MVAINADKWRNKSEEASHDKARNKKSSAKAGKVAKKPRDISELRKAYQEKILDWVVRSMEFEREPVSMTRLKELLETGKTAHAR